MIEFSQVAELVDDDIVAEALRQKEQSIIEAEISLARTAPPTRLLIADADAIP